ncbi:SAM-dependent methyltransferase [Romboutsia lituseburensis]|uniref:SAM-dependent methyltransferase n=1 Tax=Romboutsia lituseburensis TaxID=1537 RepID=UPI00215B3D0F|nr:SAM-dependent methyltransferase [Romboutsia lituseburensis]MCR8744002.1 SAM-dependent methyltransferase [Romboutsia lituseburensis]
MQEVSYEKLLNIKTTGEELWSDKINHYHPYQATLYKALEDLFKEYSLSTNDYVVDFGCGKGRLNFYINYHFNSTVIGIEMDDKYYKECLLNKESYLKIHKKSSNKINFECCFAQDYEIKPLENKFYFFNPFSVQIFRKIIDNIIISAYEYNKFVDLILYYPSDDYIYYLENETPFILHKEIPISNLYGKDSQEMFLIYKFEY